MSDFIHFVYLLFNIHTFNEKVGTLYSVLHTKDILEKPVDYYVTILILQSKGNYP